MLVDAKSPTSGVKVSYTTYQSLYAMRHNSITLASVPILPQGLNPNRSTFSLLLAEESSMLLIALPLMEFTTIDTVYQWIKKTFSRACN
jgi:hypothetical protein